MEIRLNNAIYNGLHPDDNSLHVITLPQIPGRGEHQRNIRVRRKDLDELAKLVDQTVSFIGVTKKGTGGTGIGKCTFCLIREQESNPADAEADAAAAASEKANIEKAKKR